VVEEDTVGGVHAVGLACVLHTVSLPQSSMRSLRRPTVILDDPESVELGDSVRGARVEGSSLGLGSLDHLAVKLRGGGLRVRAWRVSSPAKACWIPRNNRPGRIGRGGSSRKS
jgi:hypothetical protein